MLTVKIESKLNDGATHTQVYSCYSYSKSVVNEKIMVDFVSGIDNVEIEMHTGIEYPKPSDIIYSVNVSMYNSQGKVIDSIDGLNLS
jgi:hypothetical protein